MEENNPVEVFDKALDAVEKIQAQILARENDCLRRIFSRFCLMNAIMADFSEVKREDFIDRPNYWQYYFIYKGKSHFLMSRELIAVVKDGIPNFKLDINYSSALTTNNELD